MATVHLRRGRLMLAYVDAHDVLSAAETEVESDDLARPLDDVIEALVAPMLVQLRTRYLAEREDHGQTHDKGA